MLGLDRDPKGARPRLFPPTVVSLYSVETAMALLILLSYGGPTSGPYNNSPVL